MTTPTELALYERLLTSIERQDEKLATLDRLLVALDRRLALLQKLLTAEDREHQQERWRHPN